MRDTRSVLVAEDDANDTFLLKRAFLKSGLNVAMEFVQDGQEAIGYLRGDPPFADRAAHPLPDLFLLDLKMPGIDGFDVLKWLRGQEGLRRLCVVVFTSSEARDINRAFDLGANSYLTKPHEFEHLQELAQLVSKYWLERNQLPDTRLR